MEVGGAVMSDHAHCKVCVCVCCACNSVVTILDLILRAINPKLSPNTPPKSFSLISPLISVFLTTLVHAGSREGKGAGPFRAATFMTESSASGVSGIKKQNWKQ